MILPPTSHIVHLARFPLPIPPRANIQQKTTRLWGGGKLFGISIFYQNIGPTDRAAIIARSEATKQSPLPVKPRLSLRTQ